MRKLLNGKFLFIMASSLVVLIALAFGAYYLFDDTDSKFVKSGYILNPLSELSEKYFFNENTGYHKNLSSMIEFIDVDDKEVSVLADSFLHYDDESMSFLKNGALLDLDSIDGTKAVKFYNITSASIIEKKDDGYLISNKSGDISLNNFIGRINESKYIVVGNLQLKVPGNTKTIEGDYFEVVYVEEGIVNIENRNIKYQVTADGTTIRVGNDILIDLGDKKIMSDDEDIMSITLITIDGEENVEIIPEPVIEDPAGGGGGGDGDGTGDGTGDGNGTGGGGGGGAGGNGAGGNGAGGDGTGDGAGGDGTGTGGGAGGDGGEIKTDEILVTLKEALIGSTNVDVTFDVINATEEDNFSLQVVNLATGRTVDLVASVVSDVKIMVNLLTPNTKYLFTVVNEKDGNKYFQKIFETNGFGIKLEKAYATSESISYKVIIEEGTDVTNAKLTLYKYNEDTKQNEVVTSSYEDDEGNIISVPKITNISNLEGNVEGVYEVVYDGLESDTIYTAVLDEFSVASSNFKDIYNITLTSMTLKKVPDFAKMDVTQDTGAGTFTLSLGEVIDPDNAIVKYTYSIYDDFDDSLAIPSVVKNNASPLTVKIGDGSNENELLNDTNYYYKVIIEYFDNEKYIEFETSDSIIFMMGDDPYITVVADTEKVSYDKIAGTIYLTDNSCLISAPGREKCEGSSTAIFVVRKLNPLTGELTQVEAKPIDKFTIEDDTIKYDFSVDGLQEGTTYNIDIYAILRNDPKNERVAILHTDESNRQITTKTLTSFYVSWNTTDYSSDVEHVINVGTKLNVDEENNVGTLSPEESAATIKKIVFELYEGDHLEDFETQIPIKTVDLYSNNEFNVKDKFYLDTYPLTSDGTFGLSIDDLKKIGKEEGKLSQFYTIAMYAYYDDDGMNKVKLTNNVIPYEINRFLLLDNIEGPKLEVEEIKHDPEKPIFSNLINPGTVIGYKLSAAFDRAGMLLNKMNPLKIHYYVYDETGHKVQFYVLEDNKPKLVSSSVFELGENNYHESKIYIGYGTDYYNVDETMVRGKKYFIGYEVEVAVDEGTDMYPQVGPGKFENYKLIKTQRETPTVKMYIAKSTKDSVTYRYDIKDPDSALYKEEGSEEYNFYYRFDNKENTIPLTKVEAAYNHFVGEYTISDLSMGDIYYLYYKRIVPKLDEKEKGEDVVEYLEEEDDGGRLFEGLYDAKATNAEGKSVYDFSFSIINNQLVDNKVTIKINAIPAMLSRIVSYRVNFTDSKGHTLNKELWNLAMCDDAAEDETVKRCLSLDYTELKNAGMKSDKNKENLIYVSIEALYDNGLTGYDYKVGSTENDDFQYMIMQNNNTSAGKGSYVTFSNGGQVTNWSEDLLAPKGYYVYSINGQRISYKSRFSSGYSSNISYSIGSTGYISNYGVLNPKMISIDKMTSSNNTFSFSSITPKVAASKKVSLINGEIVNLTLSGVDLADLVNEGTEGNPEYYLYIDTWRDLNDAGNLNTGLARPTVRVKLNNSNPSSTVAATIDGLMQSAEYYYNVYAKMYKDNKPEYVQLFDASFTDKYETKTYTLKSLSPNDVFLSMETNYSASKEVYGDRELTTKFNLISYANSYPFNFDLVYVLCDIDDDNCGINEGNTNIFSRVIPAEEVLTSVTDIVDISDFDLEFNKNYYIYVYARTQFYNHSSDISRMLTYDIALNRFNITVKFRGLSEPTYVVTREALITDDGKYAIDFKVNVSDLDKTIINGQYFVKLTDSSNNVVGTMQLKDEEGNYYNVDDYSKYPFDAWVLNKSLRITDLEPDTKYTFTVYSDVYINNYNESDKDLSFEEKKAKRVYEVKKNYIVYSVNDYGVAFGRDLYFGATAKSIVVTFLGGSNFNNVLKVKYTIGLWNSNTEDDGETGGDVENDTINTTGGTYDLTLADGKKFELHKVEGTEEWRFVIDPSDMKNVLGQTYIVNLSFEVKDGENGTKWLTSADYPVFEGKAQYLKDKE